MNSPAMTPATEVADNGKIKYVVLGSADGREHTLGYLDPAYPLLAGVLAASVLKGSPAAGYGSAAPWALRREGLTYRLATEQDFADYRVSFAGVSTDPAYEYQATAPAVA